MTDPTSAHYLVRQSPRATRVSLKVSPEGVLEVVIPRGFDRGLIPGILDDKRDWIEKATRRMRQRQILLKAQPRLPTRISLQAVGEMWRVAYRGTSSSRVIVTERAGHQLTVSGDVANVASCRAALRRWMARRARKHLVPWLRRISQQDKLSFTKATIRGQKTRWGSCSSRGTISVNYKLLFLPHGLVRYVLIHELCHTRHMNHSRAFWALVQRKEPDCKEIKAQLRGAWHLVPRWCSH